MSELKAVRYDESCKGAWNAFVEASRNGTFLFNRDYMDYHRDRFPDHSWLFLANGRIAAVLPGTIRDGAFSSHGGLTYGGFLCSRDTSLRQVASCFELLDVELRRLGVTKCVYKAIPYFYHRIPTQEDLYVLFRKGALLVGRSLSSTIDMATRVPFTESRRGGIRKARRLGIKVEASEDFKDFWRILSENLMRNHGVHPVHSEQEITLLRDRFPERIRLFGAFRDSCLLGGAVVYKMGPAVHVQYIAASDEGKACGALDCLFDTLVHEIYSTARYFDFGTSTEQMGQVLNEPLLFQKEGFGGRAVAYDVYEYTL